MTEPYSYFRAKGESLAVAETAQESKRESERLKRQVCQHFGARDMGVFRDDEGGLGRTIFVFDPPNGAPVPEGWAVEEDRDPDSGALRTTFARPAANTPDAFYLANVLGLLERAMKRSRLEHLFGYEDMPRKSLPAGRYYNAFVRNENVEPAGFSLERPNIGRMKDHVTYCTGSNSAIHGSNPLDALKMAGQWYIRVSNDAQGKPCVIPPDAEPVSYEEMLKVDEKEFRQQLSGRHKPSSGFTP